MGPPLRLTAPMQIAAEDSDSGSSSSFAPPAQDYTQDMPDEILALVFVSLSPTDRNACSLACSRWMEVDATTRHCLSLDACAALGNAAPALFARFTTIGVHSGRPARPGPSPKRPVLFEFRAGPARLNFGSCRAGPWA
jgi:hypothetical protein